uniref:Estrogen receptor beta n=1 Tax=Knipowitschia caucasica TaxID=637954 RepID=A0AAV2JLL7_KNICA
MSSSPTALELQQRDSTKPTQDRGLSPGHRTPTYGPCSTGQTQGCVSSPSSVLDHTVCIPAPYADTGQDYRPSVPLSFYYPSGLTDAPFWPCAAPLLYPEPSAWIQAKQFSCNSSFLGCSSTLSALKSPEEVSSGWALKSPEEVSSGWALKSPEEVSSGWALKSPEEVSSGWALKSPEEVSSGWALKSPEPPVRSEMHLCAVCRDFASGYHYGVWSCEGCKAFFKRSIQGHNDYICPATNQCTIDKNRRKSCQACRLRKCQEVGMRKCGVRRERCSYRGARHRHGNLSGGRGLVRLGSTNQRQFHLEPLFTPVTPLPQVSHCYSPGLGPGLGPGLSPAQFVLRILEAEPPQVLLMEDLQKPFTETRLMMTLTQLADKELVLMVKWAKKIPAPLQRAPFSVSPSVSPLQRPPFSVSPSASPLQRPPFSVPPSASALQRLPFSVPPLASPLQRLPFSVPPSASPLQRPPFSVPPFSVSPSASPLQRPPFTVPPSASPLQRLPFSVSPSASPLQRPPFSVPPSASPLQRPPFSVPPSASLLQRPPFTVPPSESPLQRPPFTVPPSASPLQRLPFSVSPSASPLQRPPFSAPLQRPPFSVPPSAFPLQRPPFTVPPSASPLQRLPFSVSPSTSPLQRPPFSVSPSASPPPPPSLPPPLPQVLGLSSGFLELRLSDQIHLLKCCWLEILMLGLMWRSVDHPGILIFSQDLRLNRDEGQCVEGILEIFDLLLAATCRFRELQLQREEYVCLKAMILLNSMLPRTD